MRERCFAGAVADDDDDGGESKKPKKGKMTSKKTPATKKKAADGGAAAVLPPLRCPVPAVRRVPDGDGGVVPQANARRATRAADCGKKRKKRKHLSAQVIARLAWP